MKLNMRLSVIFQRVEAGALLLAMALVFANRHFSWAEFVVVFVLIDLSIVGYLINKKVGAFVYNSAHSLIIPLLLSGLAELAYGHFLFPLSVIWLAHIGADRMLGFGLKDVDGFRHTHLGHIGRKRS